MSIESHEFLLRPALKAGCRLSPSQSAENLLLIPEGVLRLQGVGRHILELCNGERSLNAVIDALVERYSVVGKERIVKEVETFLDGLRDRGAVEFL